MEKLIYTTTDYDKFKKLLGNRDTKSVSKIVKSIQEVGYVLNPILVNEKMKIIDGQNRLEALKELNLPVDYMVQKGLGLNECRNLNIGRGNWSTDDFIKSYAEGGNVNYQRILWLLSEYKLKFGTETVLYVANPSAIPHAGGMKYKAVKEGNAVISEEDYDRARTYLNSMVELGFVEFKQRYDMIARYFYGAVIYAYVHPDVSVKELSGRMWRDPRSIVTCGRVSDQLSYFDDAYNKGRAAKNKVFMSSDFQQGKYLD